MLKVNYDPHHYHIRSNELENVDQEDAITKKKIIFFFAKNSINQCETFRETKITK